MPKIDLIMEIDYNAIMNREILKIQAFILEVLKKYDVRKASLFGSIVTDDFNENSDIDILVEFNGKKSLLDLAGLQLELKEKLNREVDVVTYNSISKYLKDIILNQQIRIL